MPATPKLREKSSIIVDTRAARAERQARAFGIFMRIKDVAADPDGEHLWLLLDPKADPAV